MKAMKKNNIYRDIVSLVMYSSLMEYTYGVQKYTLSLEFPTYKANVCDFNIFKYRYCHLYNLKSASNLNGNLNCSKELEHYAS